MPCSINWIQPPNSKDPRYLEGRGKRRGRTFKVIPLPAEVDRTTAAGRSQWKDVGKNQQIRRMFISGGVSMFAETMRPCLEKHHGRVLSSFSEVVNKSIPFWDKLAEIDREGWAARARVEKKTDHYIYIRKAREKGCSEREVLSLQLSDCESDPDELPGQICDVQSVERNMEMPDHLTDTENRTPSSSNRSIQMSGKSEEESPFAWENLPVSPKDGSFVRARTTGACAGSHRADRTEFVQRCCIIGHRRIVIFALIRKPRSVEERWFRMNSFGVIIAAMVFVTRHLIKEVSGEELIIPQKLQNMDERKLRALVQ